MAFSTRSRWCGTVLAGADLVRIMAYWCGAVRIWRGAVRISRSVVQKCKWCGGNIAVWIYGVSSSHIVFICKSSSANLHIRIYPLAFLRICNFFGCVTKSSCRQIFVVANLCPRILADKPSSTNLRPQSIVCKTGNICTYHSLCSLPKTLKAGC